MWQIEGCVGWIAIAFFNAVAVFYFHWRTREAEKAHGLLEELVNSIDDYNEGKYKIDSFTAQPAKSFLAKIGRDNMTVERFK